MLVARPAATRSVSAAISTRSWPSGPTVRRTPLSSAMTLAASKRAFVMTLMPRLVRERSISLLTSRSSSGRIADRYSSSVTWAPRSWNIEANSTPTAPAPITMMLAGIVVERRMSSEVTIRTPSGMMPGRDLTRDPVARTTSVAWRSRSPPAPGVPSSPASWTRTFVAPSRRPRPWIQVTLFFLTSEPRPFHMRFTTMSRRWPTFAKSTVVGPAIPMPKSAALWMRSLRAADSSIALVGMQPRWRQVPPILSSSTRATLRPSCAPRKAAA